MSDHSSNIKKIELEVFLNKEKAPYCGGSDIVLLYLSDLLEPEERQAAITHFSYCQFCIDLLATYNKPSKKQLVKPAPKKASLSIFKMISLAAALLLISQLLLTLPISEKPKKGGASKRTITPGKSGGNKKTTPVILPGTTGNQTSGGNKTSGNKTSKNPGGVAEDSTGIKLDADASKEAQLGLSHFKLGKENEAFKVWTAAIESNEKDTNALFCLAQYYWDNGEEEDALDLYRKFFTANPSRNLKKQVGRTFNSATVNSYDELTDILKNRDSKKEHNKMIADLKQRIRYLEAEARNMDKRDEPELAAKYRTQIEQLKKELRDLENQ